tara:strand:+ start:1435 stop:1980 length:546 start_codon:yes stop_codon:yes gene_type:complete
MKITESQLKQIIREEVEAALSSDIQLTEIQLQEAMPNWVKKMVSAGMLVTTAAGVLAPNPAMADKWAALDKELSSMSADFDDSKFNMDDDPRFDMGDKKSSKSLPTDVDSAKDSLSKIAAELEAAGDDKFKRMDVFNKYGLQNQNTDAKSGETTFVFDTQSGQRLQFSMNTKNVPPQLVSR